MFQKLLDKALNSSEIRKQDFTRIISGIARNKIGRDLAWDFFRENWNRINEDFGSGSLNSVGSLITACTSGFNTEIRLKELQEFYDEHAQVKLINPFFVLISSIQKSSQG